MLKDNNFIFKLFNAIFPNGVFSTRQQFGVWLYARNIFTSCWPKANVQNFQTTKSNFVENVQNP